MGLAAFMADHRLLRALGIAALLGADAGLVIAMLDGRMMAGSLEGLAAAFPSSQFRLDGVSRLAGEDGLGPIGRTLTAAFECAVFFAGLVWGLSSVAGGNSQAAPPKSR